MSDPNKSLSMSSITQPQHMFFGELMKIEPPHDKTNKKASAPSEDSDQPGHPRSRVFAVCMKKAWALSYPLSTQGRLISDWADAQADLSLRWAHMPLYLFCHEAAQLSFNYH